MSRILSVHGYSGKPTYYVWSAMKSRCLRESHPSYSYYGGRGISVCARWSDPHKGFINFLEDMGERPRGMELDRIDNNEGYSRENCRWTDRASQIRNRRINKNNTSGFVGVSWDKSRSKWEAHIGSGPKKVHLGRFELLEEAIKTREKAQQTMWGKALQKGKVPINE